eukprot:12122539-Prorocentrum_lima.AAC.1
MAQQATDGSSQGRCEERKKEVGKVVRNMPAHVRVATVVAFMEGPRPRNDRSDEVVSATTSRD